ncbi:uncharacterized protein LODBEIA_P08050 [Lodderomyces beijingensis]|uniref:Ubiquitin-like protease family profile domain-containing protein n=1 Tax=Lodderomyces beijingensis TaxID=1775926 RepID=A0ABP0ZEJ9_9ASCO
MDRRYFVNEMNDDENPIIGLERIYTHDPTANGEEDNHYNLLEPSPRGTVKENKHVAAVLWQYFERIFCYLHAYIVSHFTGKNKTPLKDREDKEQDEARNIDIDIDIDCAEKSPLLSPNDSDLQIINDYGITNDFHLIDKTNPARNFRENSILIEENEQNGKYNSSIDDQSRHVVLAKDTSSALRALALKRLQTTNREATKNQYGTDLSIARAMRYSQLDRTSLTHPRIHTFKDFPSFSISSNNQESQSPITKYQESILNYYANTRPISSPAPSLLDNLISNIYKDKIATTFEQTQAKVQELITKKRLEAVAGVKPLTDQQANQVYRAWKSEPRELVIDKFKISLKAVDLQTLRDGKWINDNVIDFYFALATEADDKMFAWTSHFYTTLEDRGYQGVARWAKKRKIDCLALNKLFVPVNIHNTHWALAVVDNVEKTISYYDSLDASQSGNIHACTTLQDYMNQEAQRLNKPPVAYKLVPSLPCPQQQNGFDCGIFTCQAGKHIAQNKKFNYTQKDMKVIRRRMAYEMMTAQLLS